MSRDRGPPNARSELSELYARNFDFVWRAVRAMGVDASTLEDLVQEVFMVAGRKLDTYDRARSQRAWLLGITRNQVLQFRRRSARYRRRLQAVVPPGGPPQPDELLERSQGAVLLAEFLDGLEESTRISFVMSDFEGMRGREVATALGIPLQTHYSRVRVARQRLRTFSKGLHGDR